MSILSTRILIFVRGTSSLAQAHTSRGAARVPSSLRWSVNLTTGIPVEDNKTIDLIGVSKTVMHHGIVSGIKQRKVSWEI